MSTRKFAVAVATGALIGTIGVAGVADAGEPANQACIGDLFKKENRLNPDGNGVGEVVVGFAQGPHQGGFGTFGGSINAIQAGAVPDEVFPNTCND